MAEFGALRIYYNNFAGHLLNAYNPNMLHPELPYRWSNEDWFRTVDMVADFGFNAIEFWLVPRLFCQEGLESDYGQAFIHQMNAVIDYAASLSMPVLALCSLATTGSDWQTLCPNTKDGWAEIQHLWDAWTKALPNLGGVEIFPGDPGACSLNGCTAETYIDRSCEIAALVQRNLPASRILFNTWGPPFFGWGILQGPEGWEGEFVQNYQHTAWAFSKERSDRAMQHLLKRLPDFPAETSIGINLAFNPDADPSGKADARPWAREIAQTNGIHTWDFSLTEGENAIIPHYRLERLFAQRRIERESAPYSGGICYTMTPRLNALSLYAAAQSFLRPDAVHSEVAAEFYTQLYGPGGAELVPYLPLFEIFHDWGCYVSVDLPKEEYHGKMKELVDLLESLRAQDERIALHPGPEAHRQELLFHARLFAQLSGTAPDYSALRQQYWDRVYAIYDHLPQHVDPRPHQATDNLIQRFQNWDEAREGPAPGQWWEDDHA